MTITKEVSGFDLKYNGQAWSGAVSTLEYLTLEEVDTILSYLEDCGTMSETELNDFFWFDTDTIAEWLGYSNFEEIMERGEQR